MCATPDRGLTQAGSVCLRPTSVLSLAPRGRHGHLQSTLLPLLLWVHHWSHWAFLSLSSRRVLGMCCARGSDGPWGRGGRPSPASLGQWTPLCPRLCVWGGGSWSFRKVLLGPRPQPDRVFWAQSTGVLRASDVGGSQ